MITYQLWALTPELVCVIAILAILTLTLISERVTSEAYTVALGSLAVASLALICQALDWPWPNRVILPNYTLDGLSLVFRSLIVLASAGCLLFTRAYLLTAYRKGCEFLICFLTATLGALTMAGAKDLLTLFVGVECFSLASYLLVGSNKRDVRSTEAALKYFLLGSASSAIMVYGFSWWYGLTQGQLQLDTLIEWNVDLSTHLASTVSLICMLVPACFKLSSVPFHQWAPDVYEGAPTPVVGFLAVTGKIAALILTIRILTLFPSALWHPLVSFLAILTMTIGNLIGLTQSSMKRLLAYSSIGQVGYLMIGLLNTEEVPYTALAVYLLTYLFMNLGAIACTLDFSLKTSTDQIQNYNGLYFRDPGLTLCLSICLLSLAGMPPFAGFFAKLYVFWWGWQSGLYGVVTIGLLTSVISLYYYLRIIKAMISQPPTAYLEEYPVSTTLSLPRTPLNWSIVVCVVATSTLGFLYEPMVQFTQHLLVISF